MSNFVTEAEKRVDLLRNSDELKKAFNDGFGGGSQLDTFLFHNISNSTLLPGWWSEQREKYLHKASVEIDIIASTIAILSMRLYNLPLYIVPENQLISTHFHVAKTYQSIIGSAWAKYGELFIADMLTYDKGAFLLIEGTNSPSLPLDSTPTGLRYIPSQRIMLNSSREHPYIWLRERQDALYLHETRVIRLVQRPISVSENTSIGLSFVSRAFNVGQMMASSITYGLESLGQLDSDTIIWATSTTSQAIQQAFKSASIDSTNEGKSVKGNKVYLGLRDPSGKIGQLEIKRLPDSFNYKDFTEVTIKLLALAAGVDENDLLAVSGAGTTKSAALVSDLKSRYKLEAWFMRHLTQELETKFLPPFLRLRVGEESSNISETTAKARINLVRSDKLLSDYGAISDRAARQNALSYGLINEAQFQELELADQRLPNGLHVSAIFMSDNEMIKRMVGREINPFHPDASVTQEYIQDKITETYRIAINTTSANIFLTCNQVVAAFEWLLDNLYIEPRRIPKPTAEEMNQDEEIVVNIVQELPPPNEITSAPVEPVKKAYYKPTTTQGRKDQKILREKLKSVWSDKSNKLMTSAEELITCLETEYDIDLDDLLEAVALINENRDDMKLTDVYSLVEEIIFL